MKVILSLALVASASAFAPQAAERTSVALEAESSRRQAMGSLAAGAAAFLPVAAANAAAGESPRFSVFGVIGDGTSYSEGAAYGSDQSTGVYSPYSVYGDVGKESSYQPNQGDVDRKLAIIAESKIRLAKLDAYIARKEWFNVKDELTRYMYETRGAVRGLAKTTTQKEAADKFFRAMEDTYGSATLKKQEKCAAAAAASIATLDAFTATL